MIKLKYICVLLFCLPFAAKAQTPIKFRKVIGNTGYDDGYSVQQTHDKGYIIGGATSSFGSGSTDMYAVKTDSMGIPRIHQPLGGINIERGYSIKETTDHGYIFLGYTNSYGAGGYDFYLVKMDSALIPQWTKTYGGTDWDFGYSVKQTVDGGYILCGSTFSYGNGDQDYYLVRTNASGDTLWTKTYGGTGEDVAKAVVETPDGGFVVTGYTKSMGDSLGDIYTIRTTATGDTVWTQKYGGTQPDFGNDVILSQSGNYIVAGETSSFGSGSGDGIALKYSPAGALLTSGTNGLSGTFDKYNAVTESADGKLAFAGTTFLGLKGDMYLFITDPNFYFVSSTTFGTLEADEAYSIDYTADNAYIICGVTNGYGNKLDDIYLVKTDTTGFAAVTESVFTVGIQEQAALENNKFMVFPNPAGDVVYININHAKAGDEYELLISDMLGREVKHLVIDPAPTAITTGDLANGMYYLTLINGESRATQKLIVHH